MQRAAATTFSQQNLGRGHRQTRSKQSETRRQKNPETANQTSRGRSPLTLSSLESSERNYSWQLYPNSAVVRRRTVSRHNQETFLMEAEIFQLGGSSSLFISMIEV